MEFNQSCNKEDKVLQLPFEIIQIGALKLDENFKTISTFNKLVKPTVYKNILPYIQELTKITNEMVSIAQNFIDYEFYRKRRYYIYYLGNCRPKGIV
ncbi:MAG: exonuclease domain-containing protein [Clostridium sp.]|nr:exonuclease domain-containing protein [Clostridium sp.]